MNDINAAQREQVAANARGEAEKILVVKKAEAASREHRSPGTRHREPKESHHRRACRFRSSNSKKWSRARPLKKSCSWSW